MSKNDYLPVEPVAEFPHLKVHRLYGTFYFRRTVDGEETKFSLRTKVESEAKLAYQARFGETRAKNAATTCNKEWDNFLALPGRDDATKARHRTSWEYAKEIIGPLAPNDVRAQHIKDVYNRALKLGSIRKIKGTNKPCGKPLSDSSIKKIEGALGPFFHALASLEMECRDAHLANPVDACRMTLVRMLDERREQAHDGMLEDDEIEEIVKVLDEDEIEAMAAKAAIPADPEQRPSVILARQLQFLIEFGPEVGWRIAEALGSKLRDYSGSKLQAHRPERVATLQIVRQRRYNGKAGDPHTWAKANKGAGTKRGDKKRTVPLTTKAKGILDAYIADGRRGGWLGEEENPHGLLIPNSKGRVRTATKVGTQISEIAELAGIDRRITSHYFRHTYASREYEAGVEIERIAKRMGDTVKVVETTYLHIDQDEDVAAVEADPRFRKAV